MKKNRFIITLCVLVILSLYCLYLNYNIKLKVDNLSTSNSHINNNINYEERILQLKTEYNNDDIMGILSIENSDFNEIVVQTTDNDYYLEHSLNNEYDWRGQPFLDYRLDVNESKKLIIYGHNSPNNKVPFKYLENYYDSNFLEEHKYIYFQTSKGIKKYEIFSVYVEISDWSYFSKIDFSTNEEYYNHVLSLKNKSLYNIDVEINSNDDILIIQTCSYHPNYNKYEDKFLLVIGKVVN